MAKQHLQASTGFSGRNFSLFHNYVQGPPTHRLLLAGGLGPWMHQYPDPDESSVTCGPRWAPVGKEKRALSSPRVLGSAKGSPRFTHQSTVVTSTQDCYTPPRTYTLHNSYTLSVTWLGQGHAAHNPRFYVSEHHWGRGAVRVLQFLLSGRRSGPERTAAHLTEQIPSTQRRQK